MRKVGVACAVANADVAAITQNTAALLRPNDGIREMMVDHRDEHDVLSIELVRLSKALRIGFRRRLTGALKPRPSRRPQADDNTRE
jgi:hypothetical protein